MKTYITDEQINTIDEMLNRFITPQLTTKLRSLKKTYGIEFYYDKQTNMNLFWSMVIKQIDELPATDLYKQSLISADLWSVYKNRNDVIFKYMNMKGYTEDYSFLLNMDESDNRKGRNGAPYPGQPRALEFYIDSIRSKYELPSITIADIIRMDGKYKSYFQQYTKKYADKGAIDYTNRIKTTIDAIYNELSYNDRFRMLSILSQYTHTSNMDFDTLHNLIHKGQ